MGKVSAGEHPEEDITKENIDITAPNANIRLKGE